MLFLSEQVRFVVDFVLRVGTPFHTCVDRSTTGVTKRFNFVGFCGTDKCISREVKHTDIQCYSVARSPKLLSINSLGPLATESLCIIKPNFIRQC
jgi:hypothetical protein